MGRPRLTQVSKHMISPPSPTSPDIADLHSDTVPPSLAVALEYISRKLHAKSIHLILIVIKAYAFLNVHGQDIRMISACPLSLRSQDAVRRIASRAEKKFPHIGNGWLRALATPGTDASGSTSYLIRRSLLQREVLFSTESLVLLSVDHVYTLKNRLQCYEQTHLFPSFARNACLASLRRIVKLYGNRPLSASYLLRVYEHLFVSSETLMEVNAAYSQRYGGSLGIIIKGGVSTSPEPSPKLPPSPRSCSTRGPKTPHSATDITPTTRTEWRFYISGLQ